MAAWKQYLNTIYFDTNHPASYAGASKLYTVVKQEGKFKIGKRRIQQWLQDQESYSLTRKARRHFPRSRVVVEGMDSMWDMDLMDMVSLHKHNDGIKYVLVAIDIFSRYTWCEPVKSKRGEDVVVALKRMLAGPRRPNSLRTDKGMEFRSKEVNKYLQGQQIHHIYAQNTETKANYAERVIQTLKHKVFRYLLKHNSERFVDVLQQIVRSYNHTKHRSLGQTPASITKDKEGESRLQQYILRTKGTKPQRSRPYRFKENQTVRLSHIRSMFDRQYSQKWTGELFTIASKFKREGLPLYRLKDWSGELIEGSFYEHELQAVHVDESTEYRVEKVLKRRTVKKQKEVMVRWLHWPSKYDSWIPEKDLNIYT